MQKIDFLNNLQTVVDKLQSEEIIAQFSVGFKQPTLNHQYSRITPLLFTSKSNFDNIKADERYAEILKSLNAEAIYSEQNLASLTAILTQAQAHQIIAHSNAIALYNFHNALLFTLKLSKDILVSESLNKNFETAISEGVVVFQILIEGEGLDTDKYIKIFSALSELVSTISKIFNEADEKSQIILLDSGSDTNLGIKSGVETAKSLFLIFKEVWDFITNFRFYKNSQKNKTLLDSLSIRSEIQKKVDEGVITADEGKEYTHIIKTRTDDLIGMKVLPKQIVLEKNQIENKKLLSDFEGVKLLTGGE
jgi:hypothetical protein